MQYDDDDDVGYGFAGDGKLQVVELGDWVVLERNKRGYGLISLNWG
jgi:hypothetical protein